jgi:hypothetical protein
VSSDEQMKAINDRLALRPRRLWSDGLLYVRGASVKDRHPMRFVVQNHRGVGPVFSRHAPDLESAKDIARQMTQRRLKDHPELRQHWTEAPMPQASTKLESQPQVELQPFATTHFNCIVANPVAQVWQRVTYDTERKAPGRRSKSGQLAQHKPLAHVVGQCAILIGDQPQRDPQGQVIVYHRWAQAAEAALELYQSADEEERILWKEGDKKVYSTQRIDVIFDPDINGTHKPFSLYMPEFRRPIYEDRTRPIPGTELPPSKVDITVNPQAKLDEQERRRKHREMNKQPSFEERPLRFRSITGAIDEAERRERMLKGMPA